MHATRYLLLGGTALLQGCASFWNTVIPAHPSSGFRGDDLVCLKALAVRQEKLMTLGVVESIASSAIERLAKGLERESKRYSATYSARHADLLFKKDAEGKISQRVGSVVFARFIGSETTQCPAAPEMALKDPAVLFEVDLDLRPDGLLMLVPQRVVYKRAKAKVPFWKGELDVDFQLTLSAVTVTKDGKRALVEFAKADFPMGKIKLGSTLERKAANLVHLAAGWHVVPMEGESAARSSDFGAFTATMTVIEANELGDVIGKGAKTLAEHKADLAKKIVDNLGIEDD